MLSGEGVEGDETTAQDLVFAVSSIASRSSSAAGAGERGPHKCNTRVPSPSWGIISACTEEEGGWEDGKNIVTLAGVAGCEMPSSNSRRIHRGRHSRT